jgi:hypothetical protein
MTRARAPKAPQRAVAPTSPASASTALVLRGERDEVALTDTGLVLVEETARDGGSRNLCAARLGVARSTFQQLMRRDERILLAFERGESELESEVASLLLKAARKGHVVSAIYFSKARLGWRENDPTPSPQANIQIVQLPAAMTHEQWEAHRAQQRALASPPIDVEATEVKS